MPSGANNVYTMPVDVTLWGQPDSRTEVLSTLRKHGCTVYEGLTHVPAYSSSVPFSKNSSVPNVPVCRTFLNPTEVMFATNNGGISTEFLNQYF